MIFAYKDGGNSRKISGILTSAQRELTTGIVGAEAYYYYYYYHHHHHHLSMFLINIQLP
jgi:hypothetical protein